MCDVLLLDDEEVVRLVLVDLLREQGLTVRAVAHPDEALSDDGPYAMLLTDIDLGVREMDGFGVARAMRERQPDLPVLFISGRPWKLTEHHPGERDRLLAKPFRLPELMSAVRQLLDGAPAHGVVATYQR